MFEHDLCIVVDHLGLVAEHNHNQDHLGHEPQNHDHRDQDLDNSLHKICSNLIDTDLEPLKLKEEQAHDPGRWCLVIV